MSFWNIFGSMAVSDKGETIQRLSDSMSVSSSGVTYTKMGHFTYGSDGSVFNLDGHFKFPHLWPVKFPCQDVRFNYASFNLIREAASFIL